MIRRAVLLITLATVPARAVASQELMHPAWLSHGTVPIDTGVTLLSVNTGAMRGDGVGGFPFSAALRFDRRSTERVTPLGRWSLLTSVARASDRRGESLIAGDLAAVSQRRLSHALDLRTTIGYRGQFRSVDAVRADLELRLRAAWRTSLSVGFEHLFGGVLEREPSIASSMPATPMSALAPGSPDDGPPSYTHGQPGGRIRWSAVRAAAGGRHRGLDWRVSYWHAVDRRMVGALRSSAARDGANIELARSITRRLSAVAGMGFGQWAAPDGRMQPSLGLRWRPDGDVNAPGLEADSSSLAGMFETGEMMRLRVRAEGARRVEVLGDVTGWQVKQLIRDRERGWWYLELVPKPGVQRISIRVDGGRWSAPPGMLVELGDYGGTAGVMKVP